VSFGRMTCCSQASNTDISFWAWTGWKLLPADAAAVAAREALAYLSVLIRWRPLIE